jgi:CDP-diacylglycerol--glycerol-3-phosphate 3-phosphatidyltransferase
MSLIVTQNTGTFWHDRLLVRTVMPWVPHWLMPNHLTIFRMVMTPAAVWLIASGRFGLGIPFFLFLAFTDALDGALARTRKCVTEWGMIFDPVADKLLIGSMMIALLFQHFPAELTAVIVGLEAVFLAGGYFRRRQGVVSAANVWGKYKMLLQVAGLALFLCSLAYQMPDLARLSYLVLVAATLLAVVSLFKQGV